MTPKTRKRCARVTVNAGHSAVFVYSKDCAINLYKNFQF